MSTERLFDERTLRKLEQLMWVADKVRAGAIKGERRSAKRGTSIEFADYRNYARGDDPRRVDWNIYARLGRLMVKLREDEEDLAAYVLLDASASMDWPREDARAWHKFLYARRLAAGLAYIALSGGDQVTVAALREDGMPQWGPARGRGRLLELLGWLERLHTRGALNLNAALEAFARRTVRPGVCVLISDLMSAEGVEAGLRALQGRGHQVALVHVLSPDEVAPQLAGDLRLVDVETGVPHDVTVDAEALARYTERLAAWQAAIRALCVRRGVRYVALETRTPWEQVILAELRRVGVVR